MLIIRERPTGNGGVLDPNVDDADDALASGGNSANSWDAMHKTIVTDPCEFHRMMDEEKALAAEAAVTTEHPPEIVWSDWSYAPWRKVGRLPKNAWRAKKRERAAQRRKRWMARHPGK
jgi:hypothetical protein